MFICQQRVVLGNVKSSLTYVNSDVLQGSFLGVILFAVYFSSYQTSNASSRVVKCADDITSIIPVYKNSFDDVTVTNEEIPCFENWYMGHKMCINFTKTEVLDVNFSTKLFCLIMLYCNKTTWCSF